MRGSEARITILGKRAVISISDAVRNTSRRRFSIAHELGHLEMHRSGSSLAMCTEGDISESGTNVSKGREREANIFAASLLMPRRFFAPMCYNREPTLDAISDLAKAFRTSFTATGIRYMQYAQEAAALLYSKDGVIRWRNSSSAFDSLELYIPVGERLDQGTLASLYLRNGTIPSGPKHVLASTWIESSHCKKGAKILEHSRYMPGLNGIVTVLWVDDDILDEDYYDQL
ncbi:MAG: ImmA/IrrE family metallo-endopeptidase [Caldilineaceae bacterium]